jgi:prevent-host-death family protein
MKTISIRELHNKTGAWVRRADEEQEIIVTDRGRAVAVLHPSPARNGPKKTWKNRPLHPAYAASLKAGRFHSTTDSTEALSKERDAWR